MHASDTGKHCLMDKFVPSSSTMLLSMKHGASGMFAPMCSFLLSVSSGSGFINHQLDKVGSQQGVPEPHVIIRPKGQGWSGAFLIPETAQDSEKGQSKLLI